MRATVGNSGLCCYVCVTSSEGFDYLPCLLILYHGAIEAITKVFISYMHKKKGRRKKKKEKKKRKEKKGGGGGVGGGGASSGSNRVEEN